MQRFQSLSMVPGETRQILRDRLLRFLGHEQQQLSSGNDGVFYRDEDVLALLFNIDFEFGNDNASISAIYDAAARAYGDGLSFEDRIATGWARIVWGRLNVPDEVNFALIRSIVNPGAFKSVLEARYKERIFIKETDGLPPELLGIAHSIEKQQFEIRSLNCQSPVWVMARLWDRLSSNGNDIDNLRHWVDLYHVLSPQEFVPSKVWLGNDYERFKQAAFSILESIPELPDWDKTRQRFIREICIITGRQQAEAETSIPPLPQTLLGRAIWLTDNYITRFVHGSWLGCGDLLLLLTLLINDVDQLPSRAPSNNLMARIIGLLITRPDVLFHFQLLLPNHPRLLADILLDSRTTALGCWIISQWQPSGSAWDREIVEREQTLSRAFAFEDAAAILSWKLANDASPPAEVAALLTELHLQAPRGFIDDLSGQEPLRLALCKVLLDQEPSILVAMVTALLASDKYTREAGISLAAALEIVSLGEIATHVDASMIVTAYIDHITDNVSTHSVARIGKQGAAALLTVANQTPGLRKQFLWSVDIRVMIASLAEKETNPFTIQDRVAKALRAHIRVLCRAVAGHTELIPDDLMEALIGAVKSGAVAHQEKDKIAAFAPRYERAFFANEQDRPIAIDLAAALWALNEEMRSRLLVTILETDEPMVLAQLLPIAPPNTRADISRRIEALPPPDAGNIQSLPEMQARIDDLLSAGAVNAARKFMEAEESLQTFGKVAGREVLRFRSHLRLLLAQNDWSGILQTKTPLSLVQMDKEEAEELLQFFRGLTFLLRHEPRTPEAAVEIFEQLYHRKPHVMMYAVNRIAAQIGMLLSTDLFGTLNASQARRGQQILVECESLLAKPSIDASHQKTIKSNQAILYLALGEPQQALVLLTGVDAEQVDERVQAYRAVALHRLGRFGEALTILKEIESIIGKSPTLTAVREQIEKATAFVGSPTVSFDDDPVPRIREAYLSLRTLDPIRQTQVLSIEADPFTDFVVSQVRGAAASVINLVPMMSMISFERCENDINSLIKQFLVSRLAFLQWSAPDQSLGGFTAAQNPGERDITIEQGSTVLTVIEAQIVKNPVSWQTVRGEIQEHFKRLLCYATCRLFFHLTYVYTQSVQQVIAELKNIAATELPPSYTFKESIDIQLTDNRPHGFIAKYQDGSGTIQVVFLAIDMGQTNLRAGAKARKNKK